MATRQIAADKKGLAGLTFYAIDKASPFDLAQHEETNSLPKILMLTLAELQMTGQGVGDMWQTINAYASTYGGKPVPATAAAGCKKVEDVWKAVCSVAKIEPEL